MVGVARPLIADPEFPQKVLQGREATVRPCTSCNEDCRAKEPVLLCSVNPDLGPPGHIGRPAEPVAIRPRRRGVSRRVAVVGAGPAGLETALRLRDEAEVEVFEQSEHIGGQLLTAGIAPNRSGWLRLLEYYERMLDRVPMHLGRQVVPAELAEFDEIVVATGAQELSPLGTSAATNVTNALHAGGVALPNAGAVLVVDDGSNGWPTISPVELALSAGCRVTVATPGPGFANAIPAESRAQLLRRLRGANLEVLPLTTLTEAAPGQATLRNVLSGAARKLEVDRTIIVGERVARPWTEFQGCRSGVQVVGDALVPRKVAHALAEARVAAAKIMERLVAELPAAGSTGDAR